MTLRGIENAVLVEGTRFVEYQHLCGNPLLPRLRMAFGRCCMYLDKEREVIIHHQLMYPRFVACLTVENEVYYSQKPQHRRK